MEFNTSEICSWIDTKISFSADQIENKCKEKVNQFKTTTVDSSIESEFIGKWIKRQKGSIDSDLLALRTLETLILLVILKFQIASSEKDFKELKRKLMDWSEAVGLIRSLSDEYRFSIGETSMEIDFDRSTDAAQTSTILNMKPCDFEIYLIEKFKGLKNIKEIIEIIAERCGIPLDSDFEDEKHSKLPSKELFKSSSKEQSKHVSINNYYNIPPHLLFSGEESSQSLCPLKESQAQLYIVPLPFP